MNENDSLKKIISHCKAFGFIFQSSEIYDGLSAVYDYGPLGVELKNNLKTYWWKSMINLERNIVGLDSAIFMDSKTWEASGHVDAFNDPLIDNKDSKKRYRADVLVENFLSKIDSKIEKEISKGEKRFGENFDKEEYVKTNPRVIKYSDQYNKVSTKLANLLSSSDLNGLKKLIDELNIKDPVSICSTITPPLHLLVILPIIGLLFSKALTKISQPFIFCALLAETTTSPFLSSILSKSTEILLPIFICSDNPMLFSSFISITGSDLRPSINKNINFSVIFVILPSIIFPSAKFFVFES